MRIETICSMRAGKEVGGRETRTTFPKIANRALVKRSTRDCDSNPPLPPLYIVARSACVWETCPLSVSFLSLRYCESRRGEHDAAVESFTVSLNSISDGIEEEVLRCSFALKATVEKTDELVGSLFAEMNKDSLLVTKEARYLSECWAQVRFPAFLFPFFGNAAVLFLKLRSTSCCSGARARSAASARDVRLVDEWG